MRHSVELIADAERDPEGARSAAVVAAYLRFERIRDTCSALRRQLLLGSMAWLAAALTVPALRSGLEGGVGLFGLAVVTTALVEWRAGSHLNRSIDTTPTLVSRMSTSLPRQGPRG